MGIEEYQVQSTDTGRAKSRPTNTQLLLAYAESSSVTSQIDRFLDERFRVSLLEKVPQIALDYPKIVACDIVPLVKDDVRKSRVLMFRLSVPSAGSPPITKVPIVGKFKRSPRGRETFDIARHLWENGFRAPGRLRICQPIAYLEEWRLLLLYYASGISLRDLLAAGHKSFASCVTQAGQWLAKLHQTVIAGTRERSVPNEMRKVENIYERMAKKFPSLDRRARWVAEEILQRIESVNSGSFRMIHGDYLGKNILSDGSNMTVIDLGKMSLFDPAKDIGKFVGNMTIKAWRYATNFDTADLRDRFLEGYAQEISTGFSQRIAAYEALPYLRQSSSEDVTEGALYWLQRAEETIKGEEKKRA